jgi:hypothetical protein
MVCDRLQHHCLTPACAPCRLATVSTSGCPAAPAHVLQAGVQALCWQWPQAVSGREAGGCSSSHEIHTTPSSSITARRRCRRTARRRRRWQQWQQQGGPQVCVGAEAYQSRLRNCSLCAERRIVTCAGAFVLSTCVALDGNVGVTGSLGGSVLVPLTLRPVCWHECIASHTLWSSCMV